MEHPKTTEEKVDKDSCCDKSFCCDIKGTCCGKAYTCNGKKILIG
jgi:hypothetical protein